MKGWGQKGDHVTNRHVTLRRNIVTLEFDATAWELGFQCRQTWEDETLA